MHRVFILYTGGTIGMRLENPEVAGSPLIPQDWQSLQSAMPALGPDGYFYKEKGITFEYHSFEKVLDSSDFSPAHWSEIARTIYSHYHQFDGFIIIHGTDTMAYTASALSFALENLGKPVVLTGSQLPVFHPRSDATGNLSNAIHIAAAGAFGLPLLPEVMICFNDRLLRGNRSTKSSSRDFSGFESPSYPALGDLRESIHIRAENIREIPSQPLRLQAAFESNIITVTLFPGFDPDFLIRLSDDEQLKGVVIRSFGSGNAPSSPAFVNALGQLTARGKTLLNISQCLEGMVNMKKYKAGASLEECGVISGSDMTLEAATTKMMWLLGRSDAVNLRQSFTRNIRGELSIVA